MSLRQLFGEQALRLLRTAWERMNEPTIIPKIPNVTTGPIQVPNNTPGTKMLAEELYSIISNPEPFELNSPLTFINNTNQSPIQIIQNTPPGVDDFETPPPITVTRTINNTNVTNTTTTTVESQPPINTTINRTSSSVFIGVVTGTGLGSGALPAFLTALIDGTQKSYAVKLDTGSTVVAIQAQQAASAVIPNGTAVMVVLRTYGYVIVNPIWLRSA